MFVKSTTVLFALVALAQARFGQENACQGPIQALGGGEAATLAGACISTLLAGSNACDKLALADRVAALPIDGALEAAKNLVQAEKNFNPFAVSIPTICSDPSLPATEGLRGIIPLIDPAVDGAAAINTASAASLNAPVAANGKSVADLLTDLGFTSFTAQGSNGAVSAPPANNNNGGNNNNNNNNGGNNNNNNNGNNDNNQCNAPAPAAPAPAAPSAPASSTAPAAPAPTANVGADTGADTEVDTGADAPAANNGSNLQTFTGALGRAAEPITFSGDNKRPFSVGGSTFVNFGAAAARSCDRQFNACADAANGGQAGLSVSACSTQKDACQAAQNSATTTSFAKRHYRRELRKVAKRDSLRNEIILKRAQLAELERQYVGF